MIKKNFPKFQVQQWKGQTYVNIREFYVDKKSMETKPGKKGTSLSVEQYQKLKEIIPEIDSNLQLEPKKKPDEPSWSFGNMKRARVSSFDFEFKTYANYKWLDTIKKKIYFFLKFKVHQFKGKTYVDLREFYVDKSTEETKPGKKGISLNVEEYQKLKEIIPEIDSNLG